MRNQSLVINGNPLIQRSTVPGWPWLHTTIWPVSVRLHESVLLLVLLPPEFSTQPWLNQEWRVCGASFIAHFLVD